MMFTLAYKTWDNSEFWEKKRKIIYSKDKYFLRLGGCGSLIPLSNLLSEWNIVQCIIHGIFPIVWILKTSYIFKENFNAIGLLLAEGYVKRWISRFIFIPFLNSFLFYFTFIVEKLEYNIQIQREEEA